MAYKPDYGLKLLNDGAEKDVRIHFQEFALYSLTILKYQQYSTMVEVPYDGELYALSVDFDHTQLLEILALAPDQSVQQINQELHADPYTQRTFDLSPPIFVNLTMSLGDVQKNSFETFVPFIIQTIDSIAPAPLEEHSYLSYDEIEMALNNLDLKVDMTSLMIQLHIIENRKASADECEYILNILCLLHLKYIANSVYDEEPELDTMIYYDYVEFIKGLEVDFKHFIILAGNDFFKSDFYEYDGERGENQVLAYLIYKHYDRVVRFLKSHYGDAQTMLNEVISDQYFYDDYLEAVDSITTLEDFFNEVETVKLYAWADSGFDISGEA